MRSRRRRRPGVHSRSPDSMVKPTVPATRPSTRSGRNTAARLPIPLKLVRSGRLGTSSTLLKMTGSPARSWATVQGKCCGPENGQCSDTNPGAVQLDALKRTPSESILMNVPRSNPRCSQTAWSAAGMASGSWSSARLTNRKDRSAMTFSNSNSSRYAARWVSSRRRRSATSTMDAIRYEPPLVAMRFQPTSTGNRDPSLCCPNSSPPASVPLPGSAAATALVAAGSATPGSSRAIDWPTISSRL